MAQQRSHRGYAGMRFGIGSCPSSLALTTDQRNVDPRAPLPSKLFLANQKPRKSMSSPCLLHAELLKRLE